MDSLKLWIARDKDGELAVFQGKPERISENPEDVSSIISGYFKGTLLLNLHSEQFPEVTWENSPQQVELKLISNGNQD